MNNPLYLSIFLITLLSSCSSSDNVCEDITLATEQIQECQSLQKRIVTARNAKSDIIMRTELERRYQQNCVDIRYYRDGKQAAICGNKHKINEIRESAAEESADK